MALPEGSKLGPYEVLSPIGAGGMGVVYKARDTRLDRTVAIKVLPEHISQREDLRVRFEREARAVASLSHPHICTLYDIGSHDGTRYMVMELLEGETLSARIKKGAIPWEQAVVLAIQIADALDHAHRAGVTHRDVKPANIMLTRGGVKVLDFGLAKQSSASLTDSDATLTEALTVAGQIAGTLQYMSPEQLEGREADARSDIFSFGLVLYEMLAGVRAFEAVSGASLIAAVLKDSPRPIRELRPGVPPMLERLLSTCLAKNPDNRWQSARDLCHELSWVSAETPSVVPARARARRWPLLIAAAVAAALAGGFFSARFLSDAPAASFEAIPLTTLPGIEAQPALSPDGKLVAFTWTGPDYGPPKLCVKQLDAGDPLVLSHSPVEHGSPAWSPDGRQIAYLRAGQDGCEIMVVSALGGPERRAGKPPRCLVDQGMSWLPVSNQLVLSSGPLFMLSAESGQGRQVTSARSRSDVFPVLSPDGRTLAFVRTLGVIAAAPFEIFFLRLDSKQQPQGEPLLLATNLQGASGLAWAPDGRSLIVSALSNGSDRLFRVSFPGGRTELVSGMAASLAGGGLSISPQTRRMAVAIVANDTDLWRIAGPAWPAGQTRPEPEPLIASTRDDVSPDYSADGKRIAFESRRTGSQEIWATDADGHDAVQLTKFGGPPLGSPRWSPDASRIAFDSRNAGVASIIYVVGANGGPATRLTPDSANNRLPAWSDDGRWIYFESGRSGRSEIWKMPADGGTAVQVTRDGGSAPQRFSGDLYWWAGNSIWHMPESGGAPEKVLDFGSASSWAPGRDGLALLARPQMAFYSFRDQKASVLQQLPKPVSPRVLRRPAIAMSPDEKWILFPMTALDRGDLMLFEGFR